MNTSSKTIITKPFNAQAFKKYGDVIETEGAHNFKINNGLCTRYHDLAKIEVSGPKARPLISLVKSMPYTLPLTLAMVERHPLGSQAFVPLSNKPFLIVVCDDHDGVPGTPSAFISSNQQGVNIAQNVWHGVLTPLDDVSDFLVIDRGGDGNNLEEYFFDEPFIIVAR